MASGGASRRMTDAEIAELASWIAEAGLAGRPETTVVAGFCDRVVALGLPLARAIVFIDTLHPVYEGRMFRWEREKPEATLAEYGRITEGEVAERWRSSPFYRLLASGESLLRRRIAAENEAEFAIFPELRAAAITDYVAIVNRFAAEGVIGEMDCVYSSWMTDRAGGFDDGDIAALQRLMPFLGLAVKSASLGRVAETLVETYLGRDAGRRVLSGRIARGVAERIEAVLWFSDLRNYTRISDTSSPEQIIPLLNDYADAVVSAIHQHDGDVLKLIGDGVLAMFPAAAEPPVESAALDSRSPRDGWLPVASACFPHRPGACQSAIRSIVVFVNYLEEHVPCASAPRFRARCRSTHDRVCARIQET
jgi:adenylate cyclase